MKSQKGNIKRPKRGKRRVCSFLKALYKACLLGWFRRSSAWACNQSPDSYGCCKKLSRLPTRTSARLRNQTWLMESSWYHSVTRKVTQKLSVLFYAKKVPCKSHKLPLFPIKSMTRKWALLKNNSDFSLATFQSARVISEFNLEF